MECLDWNEQAKRLLKSELVRRGISNESLVDLLLHIGVEETKNSIDSKISRGTFSAAFLLQCLKAIGCKTLITGIITEENILEEEGGIYYSVKTKSKKSRV